MHVSRCNYDHDAIWLYANESFRIRAVREITDLLLTINSAITFPICYNFSHEFQLKVKRLCCKCDQNAKFLKSLSITTKSSKSSHRTAITSPNNTNGGRVEGFAEESERLFKGISLSNELLLPKKPKIMLNHKTDFTTFLIIRLVIWFTNLNFL